MLYTPCSETEVYIALTMLDSDEVAKAVPVDRDAWKRWFPHLEPLIDRLGGEGRYDRFEYIKLKRWSAGKVAVIGDAAHALPPNIGQGGGCAMMNALSLAVLSRPRARRRRRRSTTWERNERADHRAHPAHLADARLADHLAAALRAKTLALAGQSKWLVRQRTRTALHPRPGRRRLSTRMTRRASRSERPAPGRVLEAERVKTAA